MKRIILRDEAVNVFIAGQWRHESRRVTMLMRAIGINVTPAITAV
ncbi:MAG TPA: hypothetical protein PKK43_12905 [Spirochaetota bacterium]|nr:hypothetical protein [Spirochaetota bacterium]